MKRRKPAFRARLDPNKAWERLNVLNMSQHELARRIGRSRSFVSDLFHGRRCAAGETRRRLMEVLQVTRFEDLFVMEETDD
ncbi:MAG: helix-turn-helix transcriptional regulator [Chloroflexota bacterium]|nr:helix-turn-helix transcriptional regulator [Chloroflexota bacterium]